MNNHTLKNLSLEEVAALRQSLNVIDIKGSSAQFIATLQQKLDNKIVEIQKSNQTPLSSMVDSAPKIPRSQTTTTKKV